MTPKYRTLSMDVFYAILQFVPTIPAIKQCAWDIFAQEWRAGW